MKPILSRLAAFGGLLLLAACTSTPAPEPYGVLPTPEQVAWQRMEMNLFVHFGPNTFTDSEWGDGREDVDVFAPTALDCRQWAAIARQAGMKGIILTAKHHDGFCLWPNPASRHTVAQSAWRGGQGDVLRELSEACRAYGLKFGVYISPWDRNDPSYGTDDYNEVFCRTLESALGSYGEVFEQWFDGACGEGPNGKRQVYDWARYHETVYRLQPGAVIFSDTGPGCRWIGNEAGMAGRTCWSRLDTTGFGPGAGPARDTLNCGNMRGEAWIPGEADVSIRPGWFYRASEDDRVKSLAELLRIYYASVGRNALLLLNVPADRRGLLPAVDSVRLVEFRAALDTIFARNLAQGARIEASNTRGGDRRYAAANLLDDDFDSYWATDDTVRSATLTLRFDAPRTFNRVQLQEYIPLGQRITRFRIETLDAAGNWCEAARETTVGYKRIVPIARTTTTALRLSIDGALACPVLNGVGLYLDEVTLDAPLAERDKQGRITLTAPAGAEIRYTTDGTAPTASSPLYEGPVTEAGPCRLQALALDGKRSSSVASYEWDIAPAAFRVVAPEGADGAADGLPDDGAEPLTRGALLDAAQPLVLDLGGVHRLTGCFYEPLYEGRGGCLVRYDLSVSRDGRTWNRVRSGALFDNIINSPGRRTVSFDAPLDVRYLRLTPVETGSSPTYGVGEFGVLTR